MIEAQTPLQFFLDHLQHLGWGVVIAAIIRIVWYARGAKEKADEVYKQTTNHMPHSLARIDKNIAILVSLQGGKPEVDEEDN